MINLPNNCYCSDLKVNPKNWESGRVSCKKDWLIYYRFYDPKFKDVPKYKKGKLVLVRGMNVFHTAAERQEATRQIIQFELDKLVNNGYNPITGQFTMVATSYEIEPDTPVLEALRLSLSRLSLEPATIADMKSILKYFEAAACQIRMDKISVKDVRRKHIKAILFQIGENKGGWTAVNYNKYRRYLSILFRQLLQLDAIEQNPVTEVEKMKGLRKIREVLSIEDRARVVKHLAANYPDFHRFVQIFFHSGARRTELLKVRVRDVDMAGQTYKVLIKKGREFREVQKAIKNIALPFWKDAVACGRPEDFVFSVGLKPGPKEIRPEQVTRRWEEHVKKKLGITADLYSLKHLNTTEVVEALDEQAAAKMNSHTSTAMVVGVYDVRNEHRRNTKINLVNNVL